MPDTPEPTLTLTPADTATPTPDVYVMMTTPGGNDARMVREISSGDYLIILLLFAILVSIWVMYALNRLRGR